MKTKKKGNNWTAYYDPDTKRYFAEIIYTSREGREQYDYEITKEIYDRLGSFSEDVENERLIKTAKMSYSFENTMYGRAVFQDYRSEGAGDAAEADQGTGISLYFSLLGGKFCAFCNFCPLKALTILYEVNEIRMDDPVPFLKKTVGGKKIFGIIIPCNLFQRSVFSVLGIFAF